MKNYCFILLVLVGFSMNAQNKKWTLEECVNYALENNISIKQSALDLELADIDVSQAKFNFLPNLNANASYSINTGANINPATNQFENQTFRSASGGASSGINISSGLQNWKNLQLAKLNELAAQYQLERIKDNTSLFVANAFLDILFNKERLKVLQAQNLVTVQNIERTTELVEAGVLPEGDLLELRATSATQVQQIIEAENALFISRLGLAQLLQIQDYQNFQIADVEYPIISEEILTYEPAVIADKAKEVRQVVDIAETNYEIAQKNLELARSDYYPSLSAFVGYNTRWSSVQTNPFTGAEFGFIEQLYLFDGTSIGFRLDVPIFNRFTTRNSVKRRKVEVERSKFQLEQTNLDLEADVYQAYNDANNAKKSYEAALTTEVARSLAFEYAQQRYDVGLTNAFDYNQSKIQYENAQSDVIRTKYDYIFKLKVLEFYFGIPITDIN
ncbi:MAG: TolC family protein [Flavobacteriaceae bacterium]|nr:TolC family protein [Flavobacteriaceae bacterium]